MDEEIFINKKILIKSLFKNYNPNWRFNDWLDFISTLPIITKTNDNLNKGIDELIKKYEDKIKDQEEVIKLCHYTNLQLLKAKDNLSKGSKLDWRIGD